MVWKKSSLHRLQKVWGSRKYWTDIDCALTTTELKNYCVNWNLVKLASLASDITAADGGRIPWDSAPLGNDVSNNWGDFASQALLRGFKRCLIWGKIPTSTKLALKKSQVQLFHKHYIYIPTLDQTRYGLILVGSDITKENLETVIHSSMRLHLQTRV